MEYCANLSREAQEELNKAVSSSEDSGSEAEVPPGQGHSSETGDRHTWRRGTLTQTNQDTDGEERLRAAATPPNIPQPQPQMDQLGVPPGFNSTVSI